jgi:predicted PurR-regulated permease PerM
MNFKYIQNSFFFGFLAISTLLFFYLINNFIYTIFWAVVLAIIFYPLYKKLLKKTKGKENLSAFLSIVAIISLIIVPISLTTTLVAQEAISITQDISIENLEEKILSEKNQKTIDSTLEYLNINPQEAKESFISFTKNTLSKIGKNTLDFGKSSINLIINFFIMLYLLFFFFKDGKKMLLKISDILPLGEKIEHDIFVRFSTIVKSIFKGTLIVAVVQGSIGGLLFFILGIKAALL